MILYDFVADFYPIALQLKNHPQHRGATAEAVVVAVGIDAVEYGVGVTALVEKVGQFEAEDEAFQFVLCRGVEQRHVFVLVGGELAAHVVVGKRDVERLNRKEMDVAAVGERGHGVFAVGIARLRPSVTDVVAQFKPRDGRDGCIAAYAVVFRMGFDDVFIDGLFATSEAVVCLHAEFGEKRGNVFGRGDGKIGVA